MNIGVQLSYGGVTLRVGHKKDLHRDGIVIQYYDDGSEYGYDVKLTQDGLRNAAGRDLLKAGFDATVIDGGVPRSSSCR